MIFSRQSFLSEKTFQFHELFYYKISNENIYIKHNCNHDYIGSWCTAKKFL